MLIEKQLKHVHVILSLRRKKTGGIWPMLSANW